MIMEFLETENQKLPMMGTEILMETSWDWAGQAQLKLGLDFTLIFCTIKIRPAMVEISPEI